MLCLSGFELCSRWVPLWNLLSQYWLEIETSFCFFRPPEVFKSTFAQRKQICYFGEIHTHVQYVYSEWNQHIPPLKSRTRKWNLKPQMRVTPVPTFGAKCKWEPFKRDKSTSRDFVARGRPLCGQKRLAPLAKRSTCSKSIHLTINIFRQLTAFRCYFHCFTNDTLHK